MMMNIERSRFILTTPIVSFLQQAAAPLKALKPNSAIPAQHQTAGSC